MTTPLYSLGAKLYVAVCRSTSISDAVDTFLCLLSPTGSITLVSSPREICCYTTSNLPLGVTNEESCHSVSSKFLAPLPGTQVYKIGELHTIFYLCFLVLLVYLSVFTFVSLIKNTKIHVTFFVWSSMLGVGVVIDMKEGNIKFQFPLKKGMENFPRKKIKLPFESLTKNTC